MKRLLACAFLLSVAAGTVSQAQVRPVAFTHAVIIDGNGGVPIEDGILVIRGDRIEAVGDARSVSIPAGADVRDLKGKTVMPGLADMHVHLVGGWDGEAVDLLGYPRYLNAYLYAGVTTVLDLGNVLPYVVQLRDEIAAGRLTGPRIYCAGPLLDGADPLWPPISFSIVSADQIPGVVERLKQNRVDVLKAYAGLSDRLVAALVREARKNSLPVFVDQGFRNGGIELVMGDGVTTYAHVPGFPLDKFLGSEALPAMKQRGVRFITTLATTESFSKRRLADLSFLDSPLIQDTIPASFIADLRALAARPLDERERAHAQRNLQRFKQQAANTKALFDAGFLVVAGTDGPYPGVPQGEGLHRELELLVEAGLQPLDAITMATRNAAQLMGADKEWGTLEPGKLADVLVINGRPDRRIADTRNIEAILQLGRMLDRDKLKFNPKTDPGFRPSAPVSSDGRP
jgi:imidazolonepropionase-like amidohydrolase